MALTSRFVLRAYGLAAGTAPTAPLASATTADSALIDLLTDINLADGAGAGQASVLYAATRTLAASATEDLDLNGTALQDVLGVNVGLVRVKALYIHAAAANSNNVVVGAAATNQWATLLNTTGTLTFRPNAKMLFIAGEADATGYAVTAGTGDLLKVANSAGGTPVSYTIALFGSAT